MVGELVSQHLGVFRADAVKGVAFERNVDDAAGGFLGAGQIQKRQLERDRAVEIVQEITPAVKDGGFILVLIELVVDIRILQGFGVVTVIYPADAVRPHSLIRNAVLRGFLLAVCPPCLDDGGLNRLLFCAGQFSFGQSRVPPCLKNSAVRERNKSCWCDKVSVSDAGTRR